MRFIFQVRIKKGRTLKEYVEAWKRASAVIQRMPGARGTRLHRAIGDPSSLLAIAKWDSKETRDRAMARLREDPATIETLDQHLELGEFSLIGEFEEAEWSVDGEDDGTANLPEPDGTHD